MLGLSTHRRGSNFTRGSTAARMAAASAIIGISVAGVILATVGPVFSDTEVVSADTFEVGTLDIAASPASAALSLASMAPGDQVTGPITLSNEGSLQARYAMTLFATEDRLASALELIVKIGVTNCDNDGFAADGKVLYGPGDAGAIGGIPAFGDPASGPDPGDRLLDPTTEETLCFRVRLPHSSGNSLQNASTTITVEFIAEFAPPS